MIGSIPCPFCRPPEDVTGMKLANNCDLLCGESCSACQDYVAIEAKISAAKQLFEDLVIQRSIIRSRVNQKHDILTRRVPTEIVCSVFQFCAPADWDLDVFEHDFFFRVTHYDGEDKWRLSRPLLLGRICKAWRNIAWGMASLWTMLRLKFLQCSSHPDCVTLAREWLERAGQLPLSIRIITDDRSHFDDKTQVIAQLIALINQRSKQWKNLDISGLDSSVSQFKGDFGGAPNLQTLRIGYTNLGTSFIRDSDAKVIFSLTNTKPQPWHLSIHDCPLNSIDIEWKHLTSVSLSQLSVDEAIELLRRAPGIVKYKLYDIEADTESFPKPGEPIIYGALKSLDIDKPQFFSDQSQEIIAFLESFIFPNVKHLRIKSRDARERDELSWAPVIAHIAKSSPPLVSLSIQVFIHLPFTECIIPILQLCPLLEDLKILSPIFEHDEEIQKDTLKFFKLLADTSISNDRETKFLPNLQSMKLLVALQHQKDANQFWPHLPGIFGPISGIHDPCRRPLTTLCIQLRKIVFKIQSEDVVSQFLELQEEGIDIYIENEFKKDVFREVMGGHRLGEPVDVDSTSTIPSE